MIDNGTRKLYEARSNAPNLHAFAAKTENNMGRVYQKKNLLNRGLVIF